MSGRPPSGHISGQPDNAKVFFRIILKDMKLSLPLKFMKNYGDELSSVAKLMMPNGHVWQVQLRKEKNETIFFGGGLNDMFKYYSIRFGHFLLFKYKGMSNFNIRILDTTTCEIEYPLFRVPLQNEQESPIRHDKKEDLDDDEEPVEIIMRSNQNNNNNSPSSSKQQGKKRGRKPIIRDVPPSADEETFRGEIYERKGKRKSVDMIYCSEQGATLKRMKSEAKIDGIRMTQQVEDQEEEEEEEESNIFIGLKFNVRLSRMPESKAAVELAMNSNPKNPSFMLIMMNSTIRRNVMFVPTGFARRYLKGVDDKIKIEDCDGGEWIIYTRFFWRGGSLQLQNGWIEFYSENRLKEGDVCVFELVQKYNIVLKVSIFRI